MYCCSFRTTSPQPFYFENLKKIVIYHHVLSNAHMVHLNYTRIFTISHSVFVNECFATWNEDIPHRADTERIAGIEQKIIQ